MSPKIYNVPILKEIFHKILIDSKPYCILCFRTSDEVRLVSPNYIKMFMEATNDKTRVNSQLDSICTMCERKSKHALMLYRSALFSNLIKLVLNELVRRKVVVEDVIFEMKYFRNILNTVGLSTKLTPIDIQNKLYQIRTTNRLCQTNMVVTDSTQPIQPSLVGGGFKLVQGGTPDATPLNSILYRKLAPKPSVLPGNTASSSQQNNINKESETVIIDDEHEMANGPSYTINNMNPAVPTNLHLLTQLLEPNTIAPTVPKIITMEDIQNQSNKATNFVLHDIYMIAENEYAVPSLGAVIVDGTVIFYDSNKQLISKQQLAWSAEFLQENNKNITTTDNNKIGDINISNVRSNFVFNNSGVPQSNDLVLNDSCQKDPSDSCDAIIVNAIDTNQKKGLVVAHNGDGVLKRFMMLPEGVSDVNALVYDTNDVIQNNMAAGSTIVYNNLNKQNSTSLQTIDNRKRKKTDDVSITTNEVMSSSKVTGVRISDITSDMDETDIPNRAGTDWEDKIPMDVISFVDAVDPNADKVLRPSRVMSPSTIKISEPVSLAKNLSVIENEVIDLC